jgi:hypothetical protein
MSESSQVNPGLNQLPHFPLINTTNYYQSKTSINPPQLTTAHIPPPPDPWTFYSLGEHHVNNPVPLISQYPEQCPLYQQATSIEPVIYASSIEKLVTAESPVDSLPHFGNLKIIGRTHPTNQPMRRSGTDLYTSMRIELEQIRAPARHQDRLLAEALSLDEMTRKMPNQQQQPAEEMCRQEREDQRRRQERRQKNLKKAEERRKKDKKDRIVREKAEAEAKEPDIQEPFARHQRALRYAPKFEVPYRSQLVGKLGGFAYTPPLPTKTPDPGEPSFLPVDHHSSMIQPDLSAWWDTTSSSSFSSNSKDSLNTGRESPLDNLTTSLENNTFVGYMNTAFRLCTTMLAQWNMV